MKRRLSDTHTNQPAKKHKTDTNQPKTLIQKLFSDPNDYQRYENIYQTLCNILPFDIYILSNIAIFATGDIQICNLCNVEILELQSNKFKSTYIRNKGKDGTREWISEYIYCINCAKNMADDEKLPSDYQKYDIFFQCESENCTPGYYPKAVIEECHDHLVCKECISHIPMSICKYCERCLYGGKGGFHPIFETYQICNSCKEIVCPLCTYQAVDPDEDPATIWENTVRCDECEETILCTNCASKCRCCEYFGVDCGSRICDECYDAGYDSRLIQQEYFDFPI